MINENSKFHIFDEFVFIINGGEYSAEIIAIEITARDVNTDEIFFSRKGSTSSLDTTSSMAEANRAAVAFVKWDGCTEIDFYPDEDGGSHYCGAPALEKFCSMVKELRELAKRNIVRVDERFF